GPLDEAAKHGVNAKRGKDARRGQPTDYALGSVDCRHVIRPRPSDPNTVEVPCPRSDVLGVRRRDAAPVCPRGRMLLADRDETVGRWHSKRLQHDAVYDPEDRRRKADAEAQGQNRSHGEKRLRAKAARGMAKIGDEIAHDDLSKRAEVPSESRISKAMALEMRLALTLSAKRTSVHRHSPDAARPRSKMGRRVADRDGRRVS